MRLSNPSPRLFRNEDLGTFILYEASWSTIGKVVVRKRLSDSFTSSREQITRMNRQRWISLKAVERESTLYHGIDYKLLK